MNEATYINLYNEFSQVIKEYSAEALNQGREEAFEKFRENGFPAPKDEAYRNCHLPEKLSIEYGMNVKRLMFRIDRNDIFKCNILSINAIPAFMVNDNFCISDNQKNRLPEGIVFCSLAEAEKLYPDVVEKYLFRQSRKSDDGFVSFNSAFVQNGYFLYIRKGAQLAKPLQLINILRSTVDLMTFTHNLIVIESGATAKLLVCDHVIDNVEFFASQVTEIFVEEEAAFDYYNLEESSDRTARHASLYIEQATKSSVLVNGITLANGITRNNCRIELNGVNADATLCGMAVQSAGQQVDTFTHIHHASPDCKSMQLFKNILNDHASGSFCGKILVNKGAEKTEAFQTNRNLCLTREARMFSRPQLEIYADDVKCSHGMTAGQLDEQALFYMQSRGLSKEEAKTILSIAFMADVIDRVRLELLKDRLHYLIDKRFRGELVHCAGCEVCA